MPTATIHIRRPRHANCSGSLSACTGATNILQSIARHAKDTVQRIVLTSSNAAVMPSGKYYAQTGKSFGDHVFSEAEWNLVDTLTSSAYHVSKV